MVVGAGPAALLGTPLRTARVPAARGGRRLVPAWGRADFELLVPADLGWESAGRLSLPGRRLADLHDLRLDADLRPRELATRGRRPRQAAADADLRPADRPPAGRADLDLPLRHRLDGQERPLDRCPLPAALRPRAAAALRDGGSLCLDGTPLRRLAHARAATAAGRHARAGARPPAALAAPRRAGTRDPAGDVRLQGRQVADEDGVRRQAAARLLGAARLRPERLGGALEWLRLLTSAACRASAAPNAPCTGCMRARSSSCSARGSASTCRASRSWSAGAHC